MASVLVDSTSVRSWASTRGLRWAAPPRRVYPRHGGHTRRRPSTTLRAVAVGRAGMIDRLATASVGREKHILT